MISVGVDEGAIRGIPDLDRPIFARGSDVFTIGRPRYCPDQVSMAAIGVEQRPMSTGRCETERTGLSFALCQEGDRTSCGKNCGSCQPDYYSPTGDATWS